MRIYLVAHVCGFPWSDVCADFRGRFYVGISLKAYLGGSPWTIVCGALDGSLHVWISLDASLCGFTCTVICADLTFDSVILRGGARVHCRALVLLCDSSLVQWFLSVLILSCTGHFVRSVLLPSLDGVLFISCHRYSCTSSFVC